MIVHQDAQDGNGQGRSQSRKDLKPTHREGLWLTLCLVLVSLGPISNQLGLLAWKLHGSWRRTQTPPTAVTRLDCG